jgi:hypothetical protein
MALNRAKESSINDSKRKWVKGLALNFNNNDIAPCIFSKHVDKEFVVLARYVNDISISTTPKMTGYVLEP